MGLDGGDLGRLLLDMLTVEAFIAGVTAEGLRAALPELLDLGVGSTYGALWCHNLSSEWVRVDHKVYKFALISFLVSPRGPTK